jgi:hypothetical protein
MELSLVPAANCEWDDLQCWLNVIDYPFGCRPYNRNTTASIFGAFKTPDSLSTPFYGVDYYGELGLTPCPSLQPVPLAGIEPVTSFIRSAYLVQNPMPYFRELSIAACYKSFAAFSNASM